MYPLDSHPLDDEAPGGVVINPHSALGKELRKWEQHRTDMTPNGTQPGNPYVFRPYPAMRYKAQPKANGQVACLLPPPDPYAFDRADLFEREILSVQRFNTACQRIVKDETEDAIAKGQGWADTPDQALARYEQIQQDMARAHAEAAFAAQRMSEQARTEFAAAQAETHEHVVDVVGKKRGRQAIAGSGPVEN